MQTIKKLTNVKLAIAPINWSNDDDPSLGGDISFERCISEMHKAGFSGTEIGHKYPKDPRVLMQALSPFKLQVSSAWFSTFFTEEGRFKETCERFMYHLSFMKAVGATVINVCECGFSIQQSDQAIFGGTKPHFTEKQWALLIQGLHEIGRLAYDYGMPLSYHFHLGTGIQNKDEIDYLMRHTSNTLLGLLIDTGHAAAVGIDINGLIDEYAARINQVHLKDIRGDVIQRMKAEQGSFMQAVKAGMFTVPGDGDIDFDPVFDRLADIDYKGWFVVEAEQDPHLANPLEYAHKARQFIHQKTGL
ncbi:MAG: myo-inosose-2 dehydratase [Francisellaceae bacterium]